MPRIQRKLGRPPVHPGVTLCITSVSLTLETKLKGQERARALGISFSALMEQLVLRECGDAARNPHPVRSKLFHAMQPGIRITIDEKLSECCPNCGADAYAGYQFRERNLFCARCNTMAYIPVAVHLQVEGTMLTFDADDPTAR